MVLSREFAAFMGLVVLFLLFAFATEDARCIARARRALQQYMAPIPASIAESRETDRGDAPVVSFAGLEGFPSDRTPRRSGGWLPDAPTCSG